MSLQTPTPIPDASRPLPSLSSMGTWAQDMEEMHRWMREDLGPGSELLAQQAYDNALELQNSAIVAVAAANLKGEWSALSGTLAMPASVWHSSRVWALLNGLTDVTSSEPGVSSDWVDVGGVKKSGDTMTGSLGLIADETGDNARRASQTIWNVGGAARIPSWTTAGRPVAPGTGDSGLNTTISSNETYDGAYWVSESIQRSPSLAIPVTTDLSGIPGYVRRIGIHLRDSSGSGTGHLLVRAGSSAGIVSTGYLSQCSVVSAGGAGNIQSTTGIILYANIASAKITGTLWFDSIDGLTWVVSGSLGNIEASQAAGLTPSGSVTLPGLLDRFNISYTSGTPDAGSWYVSWSK